MELLQASCKIFDEATVNCKKALIVDKLKEEVVHYVNHLCQVIKICKVIKIAASRHYMKPKRSLDTG